MLGLPENLNEPITEEQHLKLKAALEAGAKDDAAVAFAGITHRQLNLWSSQNSELYQYYKAQRARTQAAVLIKLQTFMETNEPTFEQMTKYLSHTVPEDWSQKSNIEITTRPMVQLPNSQEQQPQQALPQVPPIIDLVAPSQEYVPTDISSI